MSPELDAMTDDELDAHRVAVLTEIEQRQRVRDIPEQVEALTHEYAALGGDPDRLVERITTPDVLEPPTPLPDAGGVL